MQKAHSLKSLVIFPVFFIQLLIGFNLWADEEKIKRLDLDQDGMIAIKEAVADPELLASFGKIDSDGDGLITRLELERAKYVEKKVEELTKIN